MSSFIVSMVPDTENSIHKEGEFCIPGTNNI